MKAYKAKWNKEWRETHNEEHKKYYREYFRKLRLGVIEHYGGKCNCCKETNPIFLTIDHINGGGRKHTREIKIKRLDVWLKRNNYPRGFQILCYNCNNAKHLNGFCPHLITAGKI